MHAPEIAPFWSRIPSFFSYPLYPGPLLACLLVAGCAYLITLIDEPWVAAAAGLVTLILVLRYVFRIMEQTSRGFLTPSEHLPIHSPERANLPYKLFAVLLIWGAVTGLLAFALFGQQPPFLPVRLLPVFQFVVNALVASDLLIIPIQTDFLALHGVRHLFDTMRALNRVLPRPIAYRALATMFDRRARACTRVLELLRSKFGERMFATVIGLDTKFREASAAGKVVQELAPDCRGAGEYARLAEEVAVL